MIPGKSDIPLARASGLGRRHNGWRHNRRLGSIGKVGGAERKLILDSEHVNLPRLSAPPLFRRL